MKKLCILIALLCALTAGARASDVTIASNSIANFNPSNIGNDVTVTVTVTNGVATVQSSAAFRSAWVGMGGFRVSINGTVYTVASVESTSALTLTTTYAGANGSATMILYKYVELRFYSNSAFTPLGQVYVVQPGTPHSSSWYKRVAASIVNSGGTNTLYIPQLTLDATTDAPQNNTARYTANFYRPDGSFIQTYGCFSSFALPPTTPTNWADICTYNQAPVIVQDTSTYNRTQLDARFPSCTAGQMLYFLNTGNGVRCLTVGTGLSIAGGTITSSGGAGGVSGSGTVSYLPQWTSSTSLGNSQLFYDAGALTTNAQNNVAIEKKLTLGTDQFILQGDPTRSVSTVQMTLKAVASQTGDFVRATDSGGSALFRVRSDGNATIRSLNYVWPASNSSGVLTNDGSGNLSWAASGSVTGTGTNQYLAIWTGASTLSTATDLFRDAATDPGNPEYIFQDNIHINTTQAISRLRIDSDQFVLSASSTRTTGTDMLTMKGIASQTGAFLKFNDSSNSLMFQVDADGDVRPRGVNYAWPASNGSGVLTNNGSGTLTWSASSTTNIRQALNAKVDYGCAGDGVTNDTTCLTNLITAVAAAGAKQGYIPAGTYLVSTLVIPDNVHLVGDGKGKTTIKSTGANAAIIACTATCSQFVLKDLTIEGTSAGSSQIGLDLAGSGSYSNVTIENVYIKNTGSHGMRVTRAFTSTWRNLEFSLCGNVSNSWPVLFDANDHPNLYLENIYVHGLTTTALTAYRFKGGDVTCMGCNGIDTAHANTVWVALGKKSGIDGDVTDQAASFTCYNCNLESWTLKAVQAYRGSKFSCYGCTFYPDGGATSGKKVIEYDVNSASFPAFFTAGIIDEMSTMDGPESSYANGAAIHSNDQPPLRVEGKGPAVLTGGSNARLATYYDTTDARSTPLVRADGGMARVTVTGSISYSRTGLRYVESNCAAPCTITLPWSGYYKVGEFLVVKDIAAAGTNNITLAANGGGTVNGSTLTMNVTGQAVILVPNESGAGDWRVVSNTGISGAGNVTTSGGTNGKIAKYTSGTNIENSLITESSNTISWTGNLEVTANAASANVLVAKGVTSHSGDLLRAFLVSTDAQPAWKVNSSGSMLMGPGGATSPDTTIERAGVGHLRTPGKLTVSGSGQLDLGASASVTGKATFYNSTNSNTTALTAGAPSSSITVTLPSALPGSTECLQISAAGVISAAGAACASSSPSLTSTYVGYGDGSNLLTGSADLTWNNTTKVLTLANSVGTGTIDVKGVSNSGAVRMQGATHPGSGGGFLLPFVGGSQSSGPWFGWCGGSYGSCSGIWLSLGINFQGASSTHDPIKIRKGTGTSSDGDLIFEFRPSSAYFAISPFGASAGNTTPIRFLELAANGTNYVSLKAPDSIASDVNITLLNALPAGTECLQISSAGVISTSGGACGGGGGGNVTTAGGTNGKIAKFTTGTNIENSLITESSNTISWTGNLEVTADAAGTHILVAKGTTSQTGDLVRAFNLSSDAQPVFVVNSAGSVRLGPGASTSVDTTIERAGVGHLRTTGKWTVSGSGQLELGASASVTGKITLYNATNSNTTVIQSGVAAASRTYTWPTDFGSAGQVLTDAAGNGTLSWTTPAGGGLTVGTTTIASGTNTRVLYNNAGVLGEYPITGTTNVVMSASPTITSGLTLSSAPLTMSGNISSAAWTTDGIRIKGVAVTLTDTTSSGTVAAAYTNNLGGNTIAASSATTFTDYYTTFITGPTAGSNVTFTRKWALGLSGAFSQNGDSIGATSTDGVLLVNTTAAAAGAQQYSPRIRLTGQGWKTNATAASQTVDWIVENQPVQGAANPSTKLALASQVNAGGFVNVLTLTGISGGGTGLDIASAAAGSGVTLTALSSGSNENIILAPKGAGSFVVNLAGNPSAVGMAVNFTNNSTFQKFLEVTNSGSGPIGAFLSRSGAQAFWAIEGSAGQVFTNSTAGALIIGSNTAHNTQIITQSSVRATWDTSGNYGLGTTSFGTSAAKSMSWGAATAPTTSPSGIVQTYSIAAAASDAQFYARTEAGQINRLTGLSAVVTSQFDKTTDTTLANITGLTRNVEASRTYAFTATLYTTSNVAGGVKVAVSGTATATSIIYETLITDGGTTTQARATALDTAAGVTAVTAAIVVVRGTIVVNAAGTLTIQFAQNASNGSASSVLVNSSFTLVSVN